MRKKTVKPLERHLLRYWHTYIHFSRHLLSLFFSYLCVDLKYFILVKFLNNAIYSVLNQHQLKKFFPHENFPFWIICINLKRNKELLISQVFITYYFSFISKAYYTDYQMNIVMELDENAFPFNFDRTKGLFS